MIHQVCHVTRNVESNSLMRILVRHNNGARAHAKTKEGAQAHYAPSPTAASLRPPRRWRAPLSAAGACAAQYASMPCSGPSPYFTTDPSRFVVDAGLAQLINANCHVLKMSALVWGFPKNHERLSLRAASRFLGTPIRVHSF